MKLRLTVTLSMLMLLSTLVYGQLPINESPGTILGPGTFSEGTTLSNQDLDCYDMVTLTATITNTGTVDIEAGSSVTWNLNGSDVTSGGVLGNLPVGVSVFVTHTFSVTEGDTYTALLNGDNVDTNGDEAEQITLDSYSVTGTDFEPTLTCPADVTINTAPDNVCSAQYTIPVITTAEQGRCSEGTITVTVNGSGALPGQSINLVTGLTNNLVYSVTNDNGTYTCSYTVVVEDDDDPYIVGGSCPSDITNTAIGAGVCTSEASWTNPALDDNCSIASAVVVFSGSPVALPTNIPISSNGGGVTSADFYPGVTTATLVVTDEAGNVFNSCTWTITTPADTEAPVVTCPTDVTGLSCEEAIPAAFNVSNGTDFAALTGASLSDNCDALSDLVVTYTDSGTQTLCAGGTITRTYTINDTESNSVTCQVTFTYDADTSAPAVTGSIADSTVEGCAASAAPAAVATVAALEALGVSIADDCTADLGLTVTSSDATASTCPIVITRTYAVTDACNNTSVNIVQIINVDDTTAPVIVAPADIDIESCVAADSEVTSGNSGFAYSAALVTLDAAGVTAFLALTGASITEACDYTVTYIDTDDSGTLPFVVTRTWTITDACANTASDTQTITVDDTTAPAVTGSITTTTVEGCDATAAPAAVATVALLEGLTGDLLIADACTADGALNVASSDATASTCPIVITRTYTVTDGGGNSVDILQTINVDDDTAPVIVAPDDTATLEGCAADATTVTSVNTGFAYSETSVTLDAADVTAFELLTGAVATDACGYTVAYVDTQTGSYPFVVTRTYTITDDCNNTASDTQTITVDDTTAPAVTGSITASSVEGCAAPAAETTVAGLEGLTGDLLIADACTADGALVVSSADVSDGNTCPEIITRTYTVTDAGGNASVDIVHTITVDDDTAPVIVAPADIDIEACDADATTVTASNAGFAYSEVSVTLDAAGVTAFELLTGASITEACGYTVTYIDSQMGSFPFVVTRTYTITDACANTASDTQTITVDDTTAPAVTGSIATTTVEGCDATAAPAAETTLEGLEALAGETEMLDQQNIDNFNITGQPMPSATNTDWYQSFTAGQSGAFTSFSFKTNGCLTGFINVIIRSGEGIGGASLYTGVWTFDGTCNDYMTYDLTGGPSLVAGDVYSIQLDNTTGTTYSGGFIKQGAAGNYAGGHFFWDGYGGISGDLLFETYVSPGAVITDACTADGALNVASSDATAGTCPIVITRTYTVTDGGGNSVDILQTINVDDDTAPVIVAPGDTATLEGCAADATTVTSGNTGFAYSETSVTLDAADVTAFLALTGASITEACDYTVAYIDSQTGTLPFVVTRTYTITDACGNTASDTQTITVDDTTAPAVTGSITDSPVEGCAAPAAVATVALLEGLTGDLLIADACTADGDLVVTSSDSSDGNTCPEIITRTYTVTDAGGNASVDIVHTITVDDDTAPVIVAPADIDIEACAADATTVTASNAGFGYSEVSVTLDAAGVTAFELLTGASITEACGYTVAYVDSQTGTYPFVVTRTYTITDDCNNTASDTQTITVDDTTAPAVTGSITDSTVEGCVAGAAAAAETTVAGLEGLAGDLAITDACTADGSLTVASSDASTGTCPVEITRTYTVTDAGGNVSANIVHIINVDDTTAPTWDDEPNLPAAFSQDVAPGNCNFVYFVNLPASTDACGGTVDVTLTAIDSLGTALVIQTVGGSSAAVTLPLGINVLTLTAEDVCENETVHTWNVTIEDNELPYIVGGSCPLDITNSSLDAGLCTAAASWTNPSLDDDCSIASSVVTFSGSALPLPADINISSNGGGVTTADFSPGVTTATLVVTDNSGNSTNACTWTITTADDAEAPEVTCPTDVTGLLCGESIPMEYDISGTSNGSDFAALPGASLSDNCDDTSDLDVSYSFTGSQTSCDGGTITRTYTITDTEANSVTCQVTFTYDADTTAPAVTGTITDSTVEGCDASAAPAAVTDVAGLEGLTGDLLIADVCTADGSLTVSSSDASTGTCPLVITRTYVVTDACGNATAGIVHTISIDDTTAPALVAPNDIEIEACAADATTVTASNAGFAYSETSVTLDAAGVTAFLALTGASITEACDYTVTYIDSQTGTCPAVVTRTYTITDACANTANDTQTITVDDTTAPVVTGTIADTTIEGCYASAAPAAETTVAGLEGLGLSIADACTADGSLTVASSDASSGTCPVVVTRTYTVTDDCNNTSVNIVHTINVDDDTAPAVTGTITATTVEGCDATAAPAAETTVEGLEGLTGDLMISDACSEGEGLELELFASGETQDNGSFNDNVRLTFADQNAVPALDNPTGFQSIYTYEDVNGTWVIIDGTGLQNGSDYRGLTLSLSGQYWINEWDMANALKFVVNYTTLDGTQLTSTYFLEGGSTTEASDNFYYNNLTVASSDASAGTCPLVITRTYTVTDACNNTSVDIIHTITVEDTTAPEVTGTIDDTAVEGCDASAAPAAVTTVAGLEGLTGDLLIADVCTADGSLTVTSSDVSTGTCPLVITRTYVVSDACGNESEDIVHTITVDDTTAPTFTQPADITIFKDANCEYDASVSVTGDVTDESENCDSGSTAVGTLIITGVFDGPLTGGTPKGVELYVANDIADLSDYGVGIAANGAASNGVNYTFPSGSASAGTYIYISTEVSNFTAFFGFAPDYTTNVVNINGDDAIELFQDGIVIDVFGVVGEDGTGEPWEYLDGWAYRNSATGPDGSAFSLASWSFSGTNVYDGQTTNATTTPPMPVGTFQPVTTSSLEASFTDAVSDGSCEGEQVITRTWTLTDACNNTTSHNQIITATDNTAPVVTGTIADTTIEGCGASDAPAAETTVAGLEGLGLSIADACTADGDLTVTNSDASTGTCPVVVTRTYTVTDDCNNTSVNIQQIINVDDDTAPAVTGTITATTVEGCDATDAPAAETTVEGLEGLTGDLMISDACSEGEGLELVASGETQDNGSFNDNILMTFADENAFPVLDADGSDQIHGYQDVYVYEDLNGTWTYIDGVGLLNGSDYRGSTLSYSGQYWIEEWDMANALKMVVRYKTLDGTILTSTYYLEGGSTTEASDNFYYNNLTVTSSDAITGTCPLVIERTYVVTDACANASEDIVHTITVEDTMNPTASNPADINVECFSNIPDPDVTVVTDEADNCDGDPTVAWVSDDITSVTCDGAVVTVTRTYSVTDCSGNSITVTQAINVDDTMDPTASNPADISVECFSDIPAADITVVTDEADNCDGDPTVAFVSDDITSATCDGAVVTVTRTYSVTDCSGNSITVTQTINVDDTMNPTASNPAAISVQCFSDIPAADITVVTDEADNCDGDLTVAFVSDDITSAVCDGAVVTVTRTYSVTDCSGNSINVTQAINVADTTSPTGTAPANLTYQCIDDVLVADADDVIDEMDNCDGTVTVAVADTNNGGSGCSSDPYIVTRTYTLTDCSGNSTALTQTITVIDDTVPTYDDPSGLPVSFSQDVASGECNFDYFVGIPNASDNCDDDVSVTLTATDADNNVLTVQTINTATAVVTLPVGENNLILTSEDDCGNQTTYSWMVTLSDNIDPEIICPTINPVSCVGDVPDEYANYFFFQIAGGILSDNCSINQSSFDMISEETVSDAGGSCVDTVKRVYYIEDVTGNSSTCEQIIIIKDEIVPEITDVADITVECGGSAAPTCDSSGSAAGDDVDGIIGDVDLSCATEDILDVDITLFSSGYGSFYSPQCDNYYFFDVFVNGTMVMNEVCDADIVAHDYSQYAPITSIEFHLEDADNYPSGDFVSFNWEATMTYGVASVPSAPTFTGTATATDNCGLMGITYSDVEDLSGCGGYTGTITRTWTATDLCGNEATSEQIITIEDTTSPVMPESCTDIARVLDETTGTYTLTEADMILMTAGVTDDCAGTFTYSASVTQFGCSNTAAPTAVTVTVTDPCGNFSTCTANVTITETTPPVAVCNDITVNLDATGNYELTDADKDAISAGTTDNCIDFTRSFSQEDFDCDDIANGVSLTVTYTDNSNNSSTCTANVTVQDNIIPSFTCVGDQAFGTSEDGTSGDCVYTVTDATLDPTMAADNCGVESVTHNYNGGGTTLSGEVFPLGTTNVVWTILDVNGNDHTCTYDVVVTDDEKPVITCADDAEVSLDGSCMQTLPDYTSLTTASDNCDNNVVITQSPAAGTVYTGEQVVTVTMTATDDNNNTETCTLDVTFTDDTAPSITCPANATVNLDEGCMIALPDYTGSATTADNCTDGLDITVTQAPAAGTMYAAEEVITVTLTATDGAMDPNSSTCTFAVSVEDSENPVATCNDLTIYLDENGMASIVADDVTESLTDNCEVDGSSIDISSFDCGEVGDNIVTLTVTDIYGNMGTCSSIVTVLDTVAPVISCLDDFEYDLVDPNDCFADIETSIDDIFDACTSEANMNLTIMVQLETSPGTFAAVTAETIEIVFNATTNVYDISATNLRTGTNLVTLTAEDVNGNITTCTFYITVNDLFGPVINSCPVDITITPEDGDCQVAVSWTPPAISDPCDAFTFTASHNPNDLFDVDSTTTVTYEAMDPAGNVTTCSFDITVEGDCPSDIDLRAQYSLQGNTYNVGDFKDQVVRVRNIGVDDSEGVISVFVSGLTAFDVVFDPNMTVANILIGTTTVNNQDWTTTVLAGGVLYTSSVVIPAGSESKIGLSTEALVAGQDGNLNISILNNSGGDNDNTNNSANKFLVISLN